MGIVNDHEWLLSSSCVCTGFRPGCGPYTGSCGAFETDSDCWTGDVCYATSSGGCCDANGGVIAGVIIGIIAFIACMIALCCCFCSSCPWAKSRRNDHGGQQHHHGQPVVAIVHHQPTPSMQNAPQYQPQTAQSVVQT